MDQLEMEVMEAQVVDWLLEKAKISEKGISFKELMRPE
jgi:FKBP-type peptidyl-prolyl cis-trans isomerase (trigger factor)